MPRDDTWFESLVIAQSKLAGYLLNTDHPRGRHKAVFFLRSGFSPLALQTFEDALLRHARTARQVAEIETQFGTRWVLLGSLDTPLGAPRLVQTIWQRDTGTAQVRFVTAYPVGRSQ